MSLEVDRPNDFGWSDGNNLLFNIGGLRENTCLCFLEFVDLFTAGGEVLADGQTKPIIISRAFFHLNIKHL